MTLLTILKYPEPLLREKSCKITEFNDELNVLIADMVETMYDAPGVGLAAPQVGRSVQLIVVDISQNDNEKRYMAMINPVVVESEGSQVDEEGCLSVLDLTASVKRSKNIRVSYQDVQGQNLEIKAEGRFAVVLQHEIDHLNGILFLDHLSTLKRTLYKKKIKKQLAARRNRLANDRRV